MKKAKILRYEDPELGPRKMPTLLDIEAGKVEVKSSESFIVDLEKQMVSLQLNGKPTQLGSQLVYMIV